MANSTSITAQKGRLFKLQIASGTSPTTFTDVTGLRATGITINGSPVDITTKSSAGWQEWLPDGGVKSVSFTGSGIYDSGGSNLVTLMNAAMAGGTLVEARISSNAGDAYLGTFTVPTFTRNGPHDNAETFDVTLQSHGPVYYDAVG